MNDVSAFESKIVCLFGEPITIANFLVYKGENGSSFIHASSCEGVETLINAGKHEILSGLLENRINSGFARANGEIAYGRLLVKMAALSNCLIMTQETLESKGRPNEHEKINSILDSLVKIRENPDLGKAVNSFAQRQIELLELRMETHSKMRWLNGTGGLQIYFESSLRHRRAVRAICKPPQIMRAPRQKLLA